MPSLARTPPWPSAFDRIFYKRGSGAEGVAGVKRNAQKSQQQMGSHMLFEQSPHLTMNLQGLPSKGTLPKKQVRFAPLPCGLTADADLSSARPRLTFYVEEIDRSLVIPRTLKRQKVQPSAEESLSSSLSPQATVAEYQSSSKEISCSENTRYNEEQQDQIRQKSTLDPQAADFQRSSSRFCKIYSDLIEACQEKTTDDGEWMITVLTRGSEPFSWLVSHYDEWRGTENSAALPTSISRRIHRKFAIRMILSIVNQNHPTSSVAFATASRVSEILSHPARRLAQFLALTDTIAATEEYIAQ
jgi:hypothetical protein